MTEDTAEDIVWKNINPDNIWILDKLILSRKLGYVCGPTGLDVPVPGYYIVRPCVNMLGLGLGAQRLWIEKSTMDLPLGYFWCEWFEGRHLSIDYHWGKQTLAVEGFKTGDNLSRWNDWRRVDDIVELPEILQDFSTKYEWINCEYINGKLIEAHFRPNEDFTHDIDHFIPVWTGEIVNPPRGYTYRPYPDVHGRIGAYVR